MLLLCLFGLLAAFPPYLAHYHAMIDFQLSWNLFGGRRQDGVDIGIQLLA
ncbi:hypothetical protein M422DRAFT_257382 [Sphaerobolus stellatus SS14]|uniref:Uncharacterized protein n=1 Tax=Sphaerobolus stellatus (strain SS14) TaxID=990650 RepID=A0A0C9VNW5_SPHS4|nr:hypothetical protein M422DRAFT_257382 [Sphaerobolus stellatus SS14]